MYIDEGTSLNPNNFVDASPPSPRIVCDEMIRKITNEWLGLYKSHNTLTRDLLIVLYVCSAVMLILFVSKGRHREMVFWDQYHVSRMWS